MATQFQMLNPVRQLDTYYRRRMNMVKSAGKIVLLDALAISLREVAIPRSSRVVPSVGAFWTRFIITADQTKIIDLTMMIPVLEPLMMICPQAASLSAAKPTFSGSSICCPADTFSSMTVTLTHFIGLYVF